MEKELEIFDSLQIGDFDFNAAFNDAIAGVITDEELELAAKITHIELIISQGTSPEYKEFLDFRFMAQSLALQCAHDHALQYALEQNESISSFMREHNSDGHDHDHHEHGSDEELDTDKSKKKKKIVWTNLLNFIFNNS